MDTVDFFTQQAYELAASFLPKVIGALVLLFVIWMVAGWAGRRVSGATGKRLDATISSFFGSITKYLILVIGVLGCLRIFGFETTSFAAVLGAAGLAVGLALQGTLSNFSAGIMLLAFRPFKVGDVVNVAGVTARVVELALFNTVLDTFDNRRIIVPNGAIFGNTIENITFHDTRRVDVKVGTDYGADLKQTREVLHQAIEDTENILPDPAPVVYLNELGGSSIDWVLRVWVNTPDFWSVREALTERVKNRLDDAEIGIPFPQMDVHLDGLPAEA